MPRKDDGPLGGLVHRKLARELALKEPGTTNAALARKYNVSGAAIGQFARRYAEEIAAIAKDADDEFAGILIAQKAFRLQAYQELYERAGTPVPKVAPNGTVAMRIDPETQEAEEVMEYDPGSQLKALKQAAEELGQLPNRVTMSGTLDTTTVYRIEGVSQEDLT